MARLMPEVRVEDINSKPERDVARALVEGLPNDCLIFHSYSWLREDDDRSGKRLRQGEIDFLILHPGAGGFVVVEVKGGEIGYEAASNRWFRKTSGTKTVKDPFLQASDGMHFIKKAILNVLPTRGNEPFAHGYVVVFPDCDYSGAMPPGANPAVVFGYRDLPKLGEKITSALRRWSGSTEPLSREVFQKMKQAILPEFNLIQALSRKVAQEEETIFRLTEQQSFILQMLSEWPRAMIEGVAGSGKTLLALAQARRFAEQGNRVLFTCYNKRLADWLEKSIPSHLSEKIMVRHFHGLAYDLCKNAGIDFMIPEDEEQQQKFWTSEVPDLIINAASSQRVSFDAIVVDEGQDFMPEWWDALQCFNDGGAEGKFYLFYDLAQNLYAGDRFKAPFEAKPFKLPHNCRNTRVIAGHCGNIIDTVIAVPASAPEGEPCLVKTVKSENEALLVLQKTVEGWLHEGLKPSQIAVLSPHKRADTELKGKQKLGNFKITNDFEKWQSDEAVLFETIRSFKGLEADAIVLYALPETDEKSHFTRADYYVASSRAKHLLTVIEVKA